MDVAVSGATGFIGSTLRASLESDGHRVASLVRPSTGAVDGDTIAWDPVAGTIDGGGLERLDAVVNLSGAGIGDKRWSAERKREISQSRLASTSLLAVTLAGLATPPPVLVSASAVGYYGDRADEVLTEDSGPGDGFLPETCVAWEDAARPAVDAGLRVAWLRSGIALDANEGALAQMLTPFKLGVGGRLGTGRQYTSWITLADEIAAIRRVIDDAAMSGPVNLVAPNAVTNAEFTATLGKVLHRPTAIPTPLLPLKVRFGAELVQHLLLDSQRVRPAKLEAAGFAFTHPELEPALRAVLARD